jgi:2-methylcitrate dehydratase PrpD
MNDIEDLAVFITSLRGADEAVLNKLRLHVADTLGAWIAARATDEGRALIAYREHLKNITATPNLLDDIALHCALARSSEVDDIHIGAMITAGSVAIPTALCMVTGFQGCDRRDVSSAILAGYEAMIRLGKAIKGPEVLFRGIWTSYFAAPFGAAAVAARLLNLNALQVAHALAHALTMSAPSVGAHETASTARWWLFGQAVRNGVSAALAAQAGFTADVGFLRSRLLPDVFGIKPDLAAMAGAKDQPLALSEVSFKPWCAARQTMAATQALREVLASGLSPDRITAITAFVVPLHLKMINQGVLRGDRGSYFKSLPYQMAITALRPQSRFDVGPSDETLTAPIMDFMKRVTVIADENLMKPYPREWQARVVIETIDGLREHAVTAVPGDPSRPLLTSELEKKFSWLATAAGLQAVEQLWSLGLGLLDSIAQPHAGDPFSLPPAAHGF